jgi:cytochrome c-type biogenesis protein
MIFVFGFLAGIFTTLSPCVLPLIPIIMGSALQADRLAPLALTLGFTVSFATIGTLLAVFGFALGIDPAVFRIGAAVLMGIFGLIILVPPLYARFSQVASGLTGGAGDYVGRLNVDGRFGHAGLGALLGLVWTPCAGPTLGAAIGMASQSGQLATAIAVMLVFSLGAAVPLLVLSYGSRTAVMGRRTQLVRIAKWGKPIMGVALVAVSLLALTGFDKTVEAIINANTPDWVVDMTTRF